MSLLSRFPQVDYVSSEQRLIFTRRGWKWKPLMAGVTLLAGVLWILEAFGWWF